MCSKYPSSVVYSAHNVKSKLFEAERKLFRSNLIINKNIGAYYSPQFVVDYMSDELLTNVIAEKIKNKFPSIIIKQIEDLQRITHLDVSEYMVNVVLPSIKICDMAMGWGVFLISIFKRLFILYTYYYNMLHANSATNSEKINDMAEFIANTIIANNIYGVDLLPQSIDVAKLRLYSEIFSLTKKSKLSLVEPNFIAGNSLVGFVFGNKLPLDINETSLDDLWIALLLKRYQNKIKRSTINWLKSQRFIHWPIVFYDVKNSNGFDIIIGNPPYINVKRLPVQERAVYKHIFSTYNSNGDLSNVFWERAIALTKNDGYIGFITPRYWFEGCDSDSLRKMIVTKTSIRKIIDFQSNRTVFRHNGQSLGVDVAITIVKKDKDKKSDIVVLSIDDVKSKISTINSDNFSMLRINQYQLRLKSRWNLYTNSLITNIEDVSNFYLGDDKKNSSFKGICLIGKGCSTGNNRLFQLMKLSETKFQGINNSIVNLSKRELNGLRKLIKGRDISQYHINCSNKYWIYLKGKDIDNFPNIKAYLESNRSKLERIHLKYKTKNYYDYAVYRSLSLIDHSPKILTPYQATMPSFAVYASRNKTINEADVITIVIKPEYNNKIDYYYLTALLNSALMHYYVSKRNKRIYNMYDFRTNQIANLPIFLTEEMLMVSRLSEIIHKVRQHSNSQHDLQNLNRKINILLNALVFELYFRETIVSVELNEEVDNKLDLSKTYELKILAPILLDLMNDPSILKKQNLIFANSKIKEIIKSTYLYSYINNLLI